jgi:hypothetical protein
MRNYLAQAALVFSVLSLCSCMIPENFTGKYTLNPNGDYTFSYDGTMVDGMALFAKSQAKEKGKEIDSSDKAMIDKNVETFRQDRRVKEFKESASDTYKVRTEEKGNLVEEKAAPFWDKQFQYWTLAYDPQNKTANFIITPSKQDDLKGLDEFNLSMNWKMEFDTSCAVVSSTVKLDKSFFGHTYSFTISRDDMLKGVTVVFQLE